MWLLLSFSRYSQVSPVNGTRLDNTWLHKNSSISFLTDEPCVTLQTLADKKKKRYSTKTMNQTIHMLLFFIHLGEMEARRCSPSRPERMRAPAVWRVRSLPVRGEKRRGTTPETTSQPRVSRALTRLHTHLLVVGLGNCVFVLPFKRAQRLFRYLSVKQMWEDCGDTLLPLWLVPGWPSALPKCDLRADMDRDVNHRKTQQRSGPFLLELMHLTSHVVQFKFLQQLMNIKHGSQYRMLACHLYCKQLKYMWNLTYPTMQIDMRG